jgi:hypothetical protein
MASTLDVYASWLLPAVDVHLCLGCTYSRLNSLAWGGKAALHGFNRSSVAARKYTMHFRQDPGQLNLGFDEQFCCLRAHSHLTPLD